MNRADRLLAVLLDGKPHCRQDIQFRKGYFLTNNAASELRKRGYVVNHWREGRVDYYQLENLGVGGGCVHAGATPTPKTPPLSQPPGADNRRPTSTGDSHLGLTSSLASGPSGGYESGASLPPVGGDCPPSPPPTGEAPLALQLRLEAA